MAEGVWGEQCISLHTVMIHDRGGVNRVYQLVDVNNVKWGRRLDNKSGAEVILSGASCGQQADILNDIALGVRRYEMVIFRGSGLSARRVWEGPIVQVETGRSLAIIIAHDGKEYLDYTDLSIDWPTLTPLYPMTTRIAEMLDYELTVEYQHRIGTGGAATVVTVPRWEQLDPPANIYPFIDVRPSSTLYTKSNTVAFQMMLGEHLDSLADGNLNYTFVGRSLVIWDSAYSIGRTRTVTDADFTGDITVIAAGTEHASIGHISAQRPDENTEPPPPPPGPGVVYGVGNAGQEHPYYGVWSRLVSSDQEEGDDDPTQDELNSQAQRAIAGRTPVPTEIRVPSGASLILSHDLTIDMLVPGVIMPVLADLNIRQVSQDQRLVALDVTETPDGETIALSLISAGEVTTVAARA